jgi:hypothetical protein
MFKKESAALTVPKMNAQVTFMHHVRGDAQKCAQIQVIVCAERLWICFGAHWRRDA